ncbi:MAG: S-adenosylmethionine:tRNA ribosyltransferase-isomerase, partial [Chitinophagaceae bacterium]
QTVYARHEGSVAAPTAGLHFTPSVIESLQQKNIDCRYITLHVGAGTFRPVKADTMLGHEMHTEEINISLETLQAIAEKSEGTIIAVGTTSLRTLESLYWFGLDLLQDSKNTVLQVNQWQPYEQKDLTKISAKEALQAIIEMLQQTNQTALTGRTGILIGPGYEFRICKGLVTNFHQPESTLLLLVSAFIGEDWRKVYDYALANDFRFLSYGDSSLLWRKLGATGAAPDARAGKL